MPRRPRLRKRPCRRLRSQLRKSEEYYGQEKKTAFQRTFCTQIHTCLISWGTRGEECIYTDHALIINQQTLYEPLYNTVRRLILTSTIHHVTTFNQKTNKTFPRHKTVMPLALNIPHLVNFQQTANRLNSSMGKSNSNRSKTASIISQNRRQSKMEVPQPKKHHSKRAPKMYTWTRLRRVGGLRYWVFGYIEDECLWK